MTVPVTRLENPGSFVLTFEGWHFGRFLLPNANIDVRESFEYPNGKQPGFSRTKPGDLLPEQTKCFENPEVSAFVSGSYDSLPADDTGRLAVRREKYSGSRPNTARKNPNPRIETWFPGRKYNCVPEFVC